MLRHGVCKPLAPHHVQLCIALAIHPDGIGRKALCETFFPDLDAEMAMARLKVYVHTLREHLGQESVIFYRGGYRFSAGAATSDLAQAASQIEAARAGHLNDAERAAFLETVRRLQQPRPAYIGALAWFGAIEARIRVLALDAVRAFAKDAWARGDTGALSQLAEEIRAQRGDETLAVDLLAQAKALMVANRAAQREARIGPLEIALG